jgi:hypothetical protein
MTVTIPTPSCTHAAVLSAAVQLAGRQLRVSWAWRLQRQQHSHAAGWEGSDQWSSFPSSSYQVGVSGAFAPWWYKVGQQQYGSYGHGVMMAASSPPPLATLPPTAVLQGEARRDMQLPLNVPVAVPLGMQQALGKGCLGGSAERAQAPAHLLVAQLVCAGMLQSVPGPLQCTLGVWVQAFTSAAQSCTATRWGSTPLVQRWCQLAERPAGTPLAT